MTDDRLPFDSTSTGRLKRKIPSVTEVLDELARQTGADPYGKGRLFDAAQRVCADELRRLKFEGGQPATLAVLVERARGILDPSRRTHAEAGSPAGPAAGSTEEGPFDLSSPFAIPPPAEAAPEEPGSIVFAPEPPAPSAAPRETARRIPPPAPHRRELTAPDFMAPRPRRSIIPRLLVGIVLAGLLLGGGYWYLRLRRPAPVPAAAPRPIAARRPREAAAPRPPVLAPTATASPSPAPVEAKSAAPKPPAPAPKPEAAPASRQTEAPSQSRAGTMVSSEWAGRAPVYMLHFSSYKSRQNAERDAERLSKKFGKPSHVLEVSLGSEGVWYRVLVGEFPTAEEAFAFRAALAAQKTPEVGLVFRVTGPGR